MQCFSRFLDSVPANRLQSFPRFMDAVSTDCLQRTILLFLFLHITGLSLNRVRLLLLSLAVIILRKEVGHSTRCIELLLWLRLGLLGILRASACHIHQSLLRINNFLGFLRSLWCLGSLGFLRLLNRSRGSLVNQIQFFI